MPTDSTTDPYRDCSMCRDEGVPARVLTVDDASNMAVVQLEEGSREVALDLVDGVRVGDFVLVHLETVIAKLNPADVTEG